MNQEVQDYIKKSKEAGFSDEQIKQEMIKVGWKEDDINRESGKDVRLSAEQYKRFQQFQTELADFVDKIHPIETVDGN